MIYAEFYSLDEMISVLNDISDIWDDFAKNKTL